MLVKTRRSQAVLLASTLTSHWIKRMDLAGPILECQLMFPEGRAMVSSEPGTGS
jgi:mandelate racemase